MNLRVPLLAIALACGLQGGQAQATSALQPAEARAAGMVLLEALKRQDSQAVFDRLAPDLQRLTTVERVRERLQKQGPILGSRITEVSTGVDDSTVEADLRGPSGNRPLVLVLDGRGRVLGWELDQQDTPIRQIATTFITAISEGRVVQARSLLHRNLQAEISPQDLLNRWKDLEKFTGTFQRLRGTVVASEGGPQQLVLVTTQFRRVTDNLFVIFDPEGHIIGVDFPEDPARPGTPLP
ncbi:DUF3887 domain-containing protein [Synechococcus sp. CS-1329]|uniref:DUF3887 domain-containing protein n=1 Tax=Synechococcus sp. CS-1329 TaxID=2847975 RepID=UPI00223C0507|nr:DUF3887 domain-containing protein [Synechococcus sp. CS-1329]MCT0218357.1 DUF3887 domain-containing protein [Synechococcus sp. CS-1329]